VKCARITPKQRASRVGKRRYRRGIRFNLPDRTSGLPTSRFRGQWCSSEWRVAFSVGL